MWDAALCTGHVAVVILYMEGQPETGLAQRTPGAGAASAKRSASGHERMRELEEALASESAGGFLEDEPML